MSHLQPSSRTDPPSRTQHFPQGASPRKTRQETGAPSLRQTWATRGFRNRLKAFTAWGKSTRVARAAHRYSVHSGGLLSNGIALTTLLSLTAALTVGWTVFMAVLGSHTALKHSVMGVISEELPGLITTGSGRGLIDLDSLVMDSAMTPTSIIAFLVMIWSAMGVIGAMGVSIRAMFDIATIPEKLIKKLGRNFLGLVLLGFSFVVSATLGVLVSRFSPTVFAALHREGRLTHVAVSIAAVLIPMLVDALVLLMLLWVVAGVRVPWADARWGMLIYAVVSALLRMVGTTAVSMPHSPLLAAAAGVVTLILWIALQMRVILAVCAWMAMSSPKPAQNAAELRSHKDNNTA